VKQFQTYSRPSPFIVEAETAAMENAAVKIQAGWKGYKVRKDFMRQQQHIQNQKSKQVNADIVK